MVQKQRDGETLIDRRISTLIPGQVPSFVRDYHPKFITFIQKYFEFMEQSNGALRTTKSLLDYQDLDLAPDSMLDRYHNELASTLPKSLVVDKRTLYKNIKQFHRARGTEKTFEALFRFMYNEEIDFYYPRVDIFKTSDNAWIVNKTLRVLVVDGDPFQLINRTIYGFGGGSALVERILKYQIDIFPVYELFLNPKSIEGIFNSNEIVTNEEESISVKTYSSLVSVQITNKGGGYSVGDEIDLVGGSGVGARMVVGSVGAQGQVKRVDIIDPGVNFSTVPTLAFEVKADTATAVVSKGALISYPGFFLNENGMLSTTKYLQDSYFYQQFSYVLKTNQAISLYRDIVNQTLHPSGFILFGSVFLDNLNRADTRNVQNIYNVKIFNTFDDRTTELVRYLTQVVLNVPQPDEDTQKLGPVYDTLERYKFSPLPHDAYFDVSRVVPGVTIWSKADSGVDIDEVKRVSDWKNLALHPALKKLEVSGTEANRPLLTRNDNRENRISHSNSFASGWTLSDTDIDTDTIENPIDEHRTAYKLIEEATTDEHYIFSDDSIVAAGESIVFTIYAMAGERDWIVFRRGGDDDTFTGDNYAWIDLSVGELGTVEGTMNPTIEDVGNGWYKITHIEEAIAKGATFLQIYIADADNSLSYAGNAGDGVYLYGPQIRVEDSEDEYIKTFGAPDYRGYNGEPLLWFDGINDVLTSSDPVSTFVTNSAYSIFLAFFVRGLGTNEATLIDNEAVITDTNDKLGLFLKSSGSMLLLNNDGSADTVSRTVANGTFYVVRMIHASGNIKLQNNDTFPQIIAASGNTVSVAGDILVGSGDEPASISLGEIIVVNREVSTDHDRQIMDYLKQKWLGIPYRIEDHLMSAPNEDYWDNYANIQIKDLGEILLSDLKNHPFKRTNMSIISHISAREAIWDLENIFLDLSLDYEILRKLDDDDKVEWLKDQRKNFMRFETVGDETNRPLFVSSSSGFNDLPALEFTSADETQMQSQTKLSDFLSVDDLIGKIVFRTADANQSKAMLICDSLDPINFGVYLENGEINFETRNGATQQILSLPIEDDTTYLVSFQMFGGEMYLSLNGGTYISDTAMDISSLDSELNIGGRGSEYFDGWIGRIILGLSE